jgi:hypothetical protein
MDEAIPIIDPRWVRVEALRLARNVVKRRIRDQGLNIKNYEYKQVEQWAKLWLDHSQGRAHRIGDP